MDFLKEHVIDVNTSIKEALAILDKQGLIANVLFITKESVLIGSLTDGDIRRGLLKGVNILDTVERVMNPGCRFTTTHNLSEADLQRYRQANIYFLPVVNEKKQIISIINVATYKRVLQVEAIIMAGGQGKRLLPLTLNKPKPLLEVGGKAIIDYNIDKIKNLGVSTIYVSINYLAEQIIEHLQPKTSHHCSLKFIKEEKPMGTIGSVKLVETEIKEDAVLIMNSDLLTTIDLQEFYNDFVRSNADMAVAATTYNVDIPYAVMEIDKENKVQSLKEKPRYTYYSNAGIYLIRKEMLRYIPHNEYFDSTDLVNLLIEDGKKVVTFPILGYWLDIGKMDDYQKAQNDIRHLNIG